MAVPNWGAGLRQWLRGTEIRRTTGTSGNRVLAAGEILTAFDEATGRMKLYLGDGVTPAKNLAGFAIDAVGGEYVRTSATAGDPYPLDTYTGKTAIIRIDATTDANLQLGTLATPSRVGTRVAVVYLNAAFPNRVLTIRNGTGGGVWSPTGDLTVRHQQAVELVWGGIAWRLISPDTPSRAEVASALAANSTADQTFASGAATTAGNTGRDAAKAYADTQDAANLVTAKAYSDTKAAVNASVAGREPALRRKDAVAETFSRFTGSVGNITAALVSGQESIFAIYLRAGQVVNKITFYAGATGATSPTNCWFTLRKADFTQLGITNDATTAAWSAQTEKGLFLTGPNSSLAPYTVPSDGLYYVGIMVAATTVPTLAGLSPTAGVMNLLPVLSARDTTNTGKTTPSTAQATLVPSALSAHAWAWVG